VRRSNGETPWQLTVYIPKEKRHKQLLERLRKIARQERRSLNFLVLEAVEKYLDELEAKSRITESTEASRMTQK
jgi:predicted DNA-binding protein